MQTTLDLYGWVREDEALRAAANWNSYVAGYPTNDERPDLHLADGSDPVWRLWQLPPPWCGPVIGPGIEDWAALTENGDRRIDLPGLPDPLSAELAWMAHWQAVDGTRSSVLAINQLTNILRRAIGEDHRWAHAAGTSPSGSRLQGRADTSSTRQTHGGLVGDAERMVASAVRHLHRMAMFEVSGDGGCGPDAGLGSADYASDASFTDAYRRHSAFTG